MRFDEIGVARQGLFVSLDRFGQLALDLQAIRSQFARARVGLEGVDLAHQRIVNWWLASRGAFRFGDMAPRRRLIAEVAVGEPERVVRRSVLGGQLDRPGEVFHRGGGLTELRQGPSQTVRRLHEARILTDELGVERAALLHLAGSEQHISQLQTGRRVRPIDSDSLTQGIERLVVLTESGPDQPEVVQPREPTRLQVEGAFVAPRRRLDLVVGMQHHPETGHGRRTVRRGPGRFEGLLHDGADVRTEFCRTRDERCEVGPRVRWGVPAARGEQQGGRQRQRDGEATVHRRILLGSTPMRCLRPAHASRLVAGFLACSPSTAITCWTCSPRSSKTSVSSG